MNLDFSPEQKQFREQIRRFLQKSDGLSQARGILDGKVQNYSAPIWKGLAEMSVQAIAIPEEHSGIGLGALELCVAAEEIGRALAPVPFLSSVCLCAEAIRLFGSEEQKAKWLPGLASGEVIGTWAAEADHPGPAASAQDPCPAGPPRDQEAAPKGAPVVGLGGDQGAARPHRPPRRNRAAPPRSPVPTDR